MFWNWFTDWRGKYGKCVADSSALQKKYDTDVAYYDARIKTLQQLAVFSITPANLVALKPWDRLTPVNPSAVISMKFPQADESYYSMELVDWQYALTQVFNTFKATWTTEIFDCDDFALLFSALMAYSCYKTGFDHQLALGIAWSPTHAFNVFIDKHGSTFVYEPQTNKIVGGLGKTDIPYDVNELWFMS